MSDQHRKQQLESGRLTNALHQEAVSLLFQLKDSWLALQIDMSPLSSLAGVLPHLVIVDSESTTI